MTTDIPHGSVVITPYQMYEEMRGVRDEVKHLASILDPALAEVRADVRENKAELKAHDTRLRHVEQRLWFAAGAAAAVGGVGGWLASVITG